MRSKPVSPHISKELDVCCCCLALWFDVLYRGFIDGFGVCQQVLYAAEGGGGAGGQPFPLLGVPPRDCARLTPHGRRAP